MIVKKYSNRRLYDTSESRYITQEELAERIREGADVYVVDAKSGKDLTQATLTQIIIESRGAAKLLPVPLLIQLIRMKDEALAEFLGRYMSTSLELYLKGRQSAEAMSGVFPFATWPYTASDAFMRLFRKETPWAAGGEPEYQPRERFPSPPEPEPEPEPESDPEPEEASSGDVRKLRQDIEDLKAALQAVAGQLANDAAPRAPRSAPASATRGSPKPRAKRTKRSS
ncbi:MAG: polyhydroxyalkanoate synthesis regulator DNA-binding domain-containing protein [Polyangiaceae bacterium]